VRICSPFFRAIAPRPSLIFSAPVAAGHLGSSQQGAYRVSYFHQVISIQQDTIAIALKTLAALRYVYDRLCMPLTISIQCFSLAEW